MKNVKFEFTVNLTLADGACWNIVAENPEAKPFITRLAEVMHLGSANGKGRELLVQVQNGRGTKNENGFPAESLRSLFMEALADYPWDEGCQPLKQTISCRFHQEGNETLETLQLMQFCSVFALDAVTRGGMLLHGALIERDGMGVILAGPGGIGKTTACSRLPETWRTLSDDITLIVRDEIGRYWAHPWPTWSRFLVEKEGGKWDVERGTFVRAICFLTQSHEMELIHLGEGEMVCLGMEAIEQAGRALARNLDEESLRKLRNIYFRNVCQMTKTVPGYHLQLNLHNPFWELIEESIFTVTP